MSESGPSSASRSVAQEPEFNAGIREGYPENVLRRWRGQFVMRDFLYFFIVFFALLMVGAEPTDHSLIQFGGEEAHWVSSFSSRFQYYIVNPYICLLTAISIIIFIVSTRYSRIEDTGNMLTPLTQPTYRSLVHLIVPENSLPQVKSPVHIFLGFSLETFLYMFLNYIDPTLFFFHPLLIMLIPGMNLVKFLIPTPSFIMVCQIYYILVSGTEYTDRLAFVGEKTTSILVLLDEIRYWALRRQKVTAWLSEASKYGVNHFIYLTTLYGLIKDIKLTPTKVCLVVGNMSAYFSLSCDGRLYDLLRAPFAQAGYEDDVLDSIFSFVGVKYSTLKKINDVDNMATKFIGRFGALKKMLRRFIIKNYLKRDPTEYDFQYLYPRWYANMQNLSKLHNLNDTKIAGYATIYERVDKELKEAWKLRMDLANGEADKDFPKHMAAFKELYKNLERRYSSLAPSYADMRQETLCMFVCGLSDTGKTTNFCPAMTRMLFRHENIEFSYHNNVYYPCRSSQYWTGYSPESSWAVVFDDPLPMKMPEIPSDPTSHPYMIFMDIANTCNVVLDQAALQDKGMKFKSKVAIATNNAEVDTKPFATQSAILNRLVQFEMIPKPEFVTLSGVKSRSIMPGSRVFTNNRLGNSSTEEYYYNSMEYLLKASTDRRLIINKEKIISHVRNAEAREFNCEFEKSVEIMDYCLFRVKKGKLPAYFKVDGKNLKEGDFLDANTLMTIIDDEYARLSYTYMVESVKCNASEDKLDAAEFVASLHKFEEEIPISIESSVNDFISYAGTEVSQFMNLYHLKTQTLIKLAAFIAAVFMVLVAVHRFFKIKESEQKKNEDLHDLCATLGIPLAQNDVYVKSEAKKTAAYKPKKYSGKPEKPPNWIKKGQGNVQAPAFKGIHSDFNREVQYYDNITEEDYDSFFRYPPLEEESDIALQYVSKQGNQEFRKKYFTKGAVLIYGFDKEKPMCKGIAVKENLMIVPKHMLAYLEEGFAIEVLYHKKKFDIPNDKWRMIGSKDDKAVIALEGLPFSFPNFVNHFVGEKELGDIESSQPQLLVPSIISGSFTMMIASLASAWYKIQYFDYMRPGMESENMDNPNYWIRLPRYIQYACTNAAGYCGSPLVGTSGPYAGKILGMHIAGDYKMSYATILSKEDIDYMIGVKSQGLIDYRKEPAKPFPQCREQSMKNSKFFDEIAMEFGVSKVPPKTKPYIKDGVMIEPCQAKLDAFHELKSGKICLEIDRVVRGELEFDPGFLRRKLTDDEAIFGFGRLNSMDMSTAIGYYLMVNDTRTKMADESKRKKYFKHRAFDGRIVTPSGWPIIQREVENRTEILKTQVLQTEYIASPKTNEALKPGKEVRLFYVGDVITLFMVRKYFGDLLADVMSHNVDNEMAIGVNPYSVDWKRIIIKLNRFEKSNYNDGDVSGMEYNMYYPEVKETIIKAIMSFYRGYDNTENTIRENLIRSLFHCRVIWEGYFHDGMTFNPSGHPLTTLFNCMVIRYWKRYTFYTVQMEEIGYLTAYKYSDYNSLIVMGDDSVEATHIECYAWYKPGKAAEVAKRFDITITTASKDTNFQDKDSLEQCSFLKRKFLVNKYGVPIPKLDKTSIETSLLYVKGRHSTEARNSCVDAALCEAFYHGPDYFHRVKDALTRVKRKKRLSSLELNSYSYYAQRQAEAYCDSDLITDFQGAYKSFFL